MMSSFTLYLKLVDGTVFEQDLQIEAESLLAVNDYVLRCDILDELFDRGIDIEPQPHEVEVVIDEVTETTVRAHVVKIETDDDLNCHLARLIADDAVRYPYAASSDFIDIQFTTSNPETIATLTRLLGKPYEDSGERMQPFFPRADEGRRVFAVQAAYGSFRVYARVLLRLNRSEVLKYPADQMQDAVRAAIAEYERDQEAVRAVLNRLEQSQREKK